MAQKLLDNLIQRATDSMQSFFGLRKWYFAQFLLMVTRQYGFDLTKPQDVVGKRDITDTFSNEEVTNQIAYISINPKRLKKLWQYENNRFC